jgi:hypothetical protein
MEDINRYARELADAIAAAVARDPGVEACKRKAREAGYELKVALEAVVRFSVRPDAPADTVAAATLARPAPKMRPLELSEGDRRFLRSLRIAADETKEEV